MADGPLSNENAGRFGVQTDLTTYTPVYLMVEVGRDCFSRDNHPGKPAAMLWHPPGGGAAIGLPGRLLTGPACAPASMLFRSGESDPDAEKMPWQRLVATISRSSVQQVEGTLLFTVVLHNPTARSVNVDACLNDAYEADCPPDSRVPCPVATVVLDVAAPVGQHNVAEPQSHLNCAAAQTIPPGGAEAFGEELPLPVIGSGERYQITWDTGMGGPMAYVDVTLQ